MRVEPVRPFGYDVVHLADVDVVGAGVFKTSGVEFRGIELPALALCGVTMYSTYGPGVIMNEGVKPTCLRCRALSDVTPVGS